MVCTDSYALGRSPEETDRLQRQLIRFTESAGGWLYHPSLGDLSQFKAILDCGTGGLFWAKSILNGGLDDSHPVRLSADCIVEASDISDAQFPSEPLEGLSDAYVHDITKPFPASKRNKYDLINQRMLVVGPSASQWPTVIRNLKDALCEGGQLNLFELDFEPKFLDNQPLPPVLSTFFYLTRARHMALNKNTFISRDYPGLLGAAGFIDIHTYEYPVSWGRAGNAKLGFSEWGPSETASVKALIRTQIGSAVGTGALDPQTAAEMGRQFDEAIDELDRIPMAFTGCMIVAKKAGPGPAA